jgi:hypothetical protein
MRLSLAQHDAPDKILADKPLQKRRRWRLVAQFMEAM